MSESYAGIEVPQGDPGGLEGAAGSFGTLASELSGAGAQLRGMPGELTSWAGPASVSYAGSCLTNSGACDAGVNAFSHAERALTHYATKLRDAQKRAKAAIQDARDAQHRIDQAQRDIKAAQDRMSAAATAEAAMAKQASIAHATGLPAHEFEAARSQAQADGAAAAGDLARAQRALADAEDDLKRAQKRGHDAMDDARDAGNAAASAFAAATSHSPVVAAFGGPANGSGAAGGEPHEPLFDWGAAGRYLNPFAPGNDGVTHVKWFGDQALAVTGNYAALIARNTARALTGAARTETERYALELRERFVAGSDGTVSFERRFISSRSTVVTEDTEMLARGARFAKLGERVIPGVGGALVVGSAAWDQWREDAENPNLTTTDRVGRSVGVGAYVGTAAIIGGELGMMIPIPIGGPLAGAAVGALVGLGMGAAANAVTPVKHFFADAGQTVANGAVDTYNGIKDGVKSITSHIPHIHVGPIHL